MKRSNAAARPIFWLGMIFAIVFLVRAEAGERRTSMPNTKSAPPIRIFDQNGQPAVNGVPSPTGAIFDVTVGGGTGVQFVPDTVNISVGDTVRWTWANSGHSVTSGLPCAADSQFCSPNDMNCPAGVLSNMGTVYQHTFAVPGTYSYFCFSHCALGMTGVVNVSGGCAPSGWSAGATSRVSACAWLAFIFRPTGSFTPWAGAASDAAGSDFMHPFEYDPGTNTWTTKAATYPDNQVNNMACGVLSRRWNTLHLLRGRLGRRRDDGYRSRFPLQPCHRRDQPGCCSLAGAGGTTFCLVASPSSTNKLYILGGFDIPAGRGTNQIWEFTPPSTLGAEGRCLPVPRGYIPTTTIGSLIYTGGGSDITAGLLTDTTDSFVYNPVADTIGTIASIPRATGETRALNFNGLMLVMGGGRTAPNPSNEVNIYNPGTNTWTTGSPCSCVHHSRGATLRPTPTAPPGFGWQAATPVMV